MLLSKGKESAVLSYKKALNLFLNPRDANNWEWLLVPRKMFASMKKTTINYLTP